MRPGLCYTIWFSQRTGSTLLAAALEATGIAGKPHEWLLDGWLKDYPSDHPAEIQQYLWERGSSANGIFGLKHSFYEPHSSQLIEIFHRFPTCPSDEKDRAKIWEYTFPNHHHIFMTRRNKVRLAVSWWKAIKGQEWHQRAGEFARSINLANAYSFDAINHLYRECSMREAGLQEFFSEGNIVPLTIVYEDFIQEYEKTVRKILEFLELDKTQIEIHPLSLSRPPMLSRKNGHNDFAKNFSKVGKTEAGSKSRSGIFLILIVNSCIVRQGIILN